VIINILIQAISNRNQDEIMVTMEAVINPVVIMEGPDRKGFFNILSTILIAATIDSTLKSVINNMIIM